MRRISGTLWRECDPEQKQHFIRDGTLTSGGLQERTVCRQNKESSYYTFGKAWSLTVAAFEELAEEIEKSPVKVDKNVQGCYNSTTIMNITLKKSKCDHQREM